MRFASETEVREEEKTMKVKEYLREIRRVETLIQMKGEQCEKLRALAVYKKGKIDPNGAIFGSINPQSREDIMVKMIDLGDEIAREISKLLEIKQKAMRMVDSLSDAKTVSIFNKRYFLNETWENIAYDLGITFQWVHELHKRGLIEIAGKFPEFD